MGIRSLPFSPSSFPLSFNKRLLHFEVYVHCFHSFNESVFFLSMHCAPFKYQELQQERIGLKKILHTSEKRIYVLAPLYSFDWIPASNIYTFSIFMHHSVIISEIFFLIK